MPKIKVPRKWGGSSKEHYTWEQKLEAVARYLLIGNASEVARQLGMNREAIRQWKSQDWWQEAVDEVRREISLGNAGKLQKVISKGIDIVEDRLDNGDWYINNKTGLPYRLGVRAKDASVIVKDAVDRKVLLEKLAERATVNEETIDNRLKSLQEEFRRFAKAKTITIEGVTPNDTNIPAKVD